MAAIRVCRRTSSSALLVALMALLMMATRTEQADLVTEITRALSARKDLSVVVNYLELSRASLIADLPLVNPLDGTINRYTFFAPLNWGFISLLPQDTHDPFVVNDNFRHQTLLRHFVRRKVSVEDLKTTKGDIVMADWSKSSVTRASNISRINDALVDLAPIPLVGDIGTVYIVTRAFTSHQAVSEALKKIPAGHTPWGPASNNGPVVESATVVVDLIAEYLESLRT